MDSEFDRLPESLQRLANEACNRFEAEWKAGGSRPMIADYLDKNPGIDRQTLLSLLIPLDIDYRLLAGESPLATDYCQAFPDAEETIHRVFQVEVAKQSMNAGPEDGMARSSILQRIGESVDVDLTQVLLGSSPEEGASPVVRPTSSEMPRRGVGLKYRLDGEIARGGMGAILKARDVDLGRDLAVKVLLDEHRDRSEVVQRFVEEAQIGGQLQHPGIVPVYELGQFPDQRPYFTMKLVKGKTLLALLEERSSPEQDRARFLVIFEQVCQAIAYAHSRRVIHRDLKPSNIMVGAFGEVQVMDWGLAKVLREGGVVDEKKAADNRVEKSIIQTIRSHGGHTPTTAHAAEVGSNTQMGSVIGTPAYMSPEQALGEVDRLNERSDVFGLGAVLCQIITADPPYTGNDSTEVLRKASRGDLRECFERVRQHTADAELVSIVQDSLHPELNMRIRDAGELAKRIASYRESIETRMRNSELARIEANTRASEERKRRHVMMGLMGSVLLIIGLLSGGYLYVLKQNAELAAVELEQERTAIRQQNKIVGQIMADLAPARALSAIDEDVLPSPAEVERASAACQRAQRLILDHQVDDATATTANSLQANMERLRAIDGLINDLEKARELESEYRFRAERPLPSDLDVRQDGQVHRIRNPADRYEQAFVTWGLDLQSATIDEARRSLNRIHPSVLPDVMVSLDRWRRLLQEPLEIGGWMEQPWQPFIPIDLSSRGGDTLTVLEDGSILASGEAPYAGYQLEFETELTQLQALRLEALLDESLPSNGPGRGNLGDFSIDGLRVTCAPRSDPGNRTELTFSSAIADGANFRSPVTVNSWKVFDELDVDLPHNAVFVCEEAVTSPSGFVVRISHDDLPRGKGESENLGRFRWSGTTALPRPRRNAKKIEKLYRLAAIVDDDSWRNRVRRVRSTDLHELQALASDDETLERQPIAALTHFADLLQAADEKSILQQCLLANWTVIKPSHATSRRGRVLVVNQDATIQATGPNPEISEEIVVEAPMASSTLAGVMLEFIPQSTSSSPGPSIFRDTNKRFPFFLTDVRVTVDDPKSSMPIAPEISAAIADPSRIDDLRSAFDDTPGTGCGFSNYAQPLPIVIALRPMQLPADSKLTIRIRHLGHEGINRFRILVTDRNLTFAKLKNRTVSVLKHAVQPHPDSFWAQMAMAYAHVNSQDGDLNTARRHAAAAHALRPNNLLGSIAILRASSAPSLIRDKRERELALYHAGLFHDHEAQNYAVWNLTADVMHNATYFRERKKTEDAIRCIQLAGQLAPRSATVFGWISWEYLQLGMVGESIAAAQRAVELAPTSPRPPNFLGLANKRKGDQQEAVRWFRRASEISPMWSVPYENVSLAFEKMGDLESAITAVENAIQRSPFHADLFRRLGYLSEHAEDYEGAARAYERAIELDPENGSHYLSAGVAQWHMGDRDRAFDSVEEALEIGVTSVSVLNKAAWSFATASDHSNRLLKLAVTLAEKAMVMDPEYPGLKNTLGVCHYRTGQWQQAMDALEESLEAGATPAAYDYFFLAMSAWQLGDKVEARRWFDKAVKWMEKEAPDNEELARFGAEARMLLGIDVPDA